MSLFRHPTTPKTAAEYAKTKSPLLAIHLTILENQPELVLLGICLPHTIVDASGFGMVVEALGKELKGEEWEAPPFPIDPELNFLEEALEEEISKLEKLERTPNSEEGIPRDFAVASFWGKVFLVFHLLVEYFWWEAETKNLFLGEDVVREIVEPVKREVKEMSEGREFVSTGDVLLAWVLKSAYANDSSQNSIASTSVFSLRPLLPSLPLYPHNALGLFSLPHIPIYSLSTTPLSILALTHRRSLLSARHPSTLALIKSGRLSGDLIPKRTWGYDNWHFSNQSKAGITKFEGLGRVVGYFSHTVPFAMPHTVLFTELERGVMILGSMRRSRWETLARVLDGY
ncbi:hypothetical protein P7C70_g593, partial [Phenoliferia sp. Uapishka_3]